MMYGIAEKDCKIIINYYSELYVGSCNDAIKRDAGFLQVDQ